MKRLSREYDHLSRDTRGGTILSDWGFAHAFGMEAYEEMKRRERATTPPAPGSTEPEEEEEEDGEPLIEPITGYDLFLINKYGGTKPEETTGA